MNIFWRPGKLKGKNAIEMWISHLLLSNDLEERVKTLAFYKDNSDYICYLLEPVPDDLAKKSLEKLVEIYIKGQKQPLPFFPNSSYEKYQDKSTYSAWNGVHNRNVDIDGEYEDPHVQLYFDKQFIKCNEFENLADEIFGKFSEYLTEVKHAE